MISISFSISYLWVCVVIFIFAEMFYRCLMLSLYHYNAGFQLIKDYYLSVDEGYLGGFKASAQGRLYVAQAWTLV